MSSISLFKKNIDPTIVIKLSGIFAHFVLQIKLLISSFPQGSNTY